MTVKPHPMAAGPGTREWRVQDAVDARGGTDTVKGHNGAKSVNGSRRLAGSSTG
jgi:hypothetical protein